MSLTRHVKSFFGWSLLLKFFALLSLLLAHGFMLLDGRDFDWSLEEFFFYQIILALFGLVVFEALKRRFLRAPTVLPRTSPGSTAPPGDFVERLIQRIHYPLTRAVIIADAQGRIISCTDSLLAHFGLVLSQVQQRRASEVFPDRFAQLLDSVALMAVQARALQTVCIKGWVKETADAPPIRVMCNPAFDEEDALLGFIMVCEDVTDMKLAERAAYQSKLGYTLLVEGLPIGVAVIQGYMTHDGLPDGRVLEANPAFHKFFSGADVQHSLLSNWPQLKNQPKLLTGVSRALTSSTPFTYDLPGGKLCLRILPIEDSRFYLLVNDSAEQKRNEQQVLLLNDQLNRSLADYKARTESITDDVNQFIHVSVEQLQMALEDLTESSVAKTVEKLEYIRTCMLQYAHATLLPYHTKLEDLREIVPKVLNQVYEQHGEPNVMVSSTPLPKLVLSRSVLESILRRLLDVVLTCEKVSISTVQVGVDQEFLDTKVYVFASGFDFSHLFLDEPPTDEEVSLDWSQSSNLALAIVRRMVNFHGGSLSWSREASLSLKISFTLGAPHL